ncbi:MAG TPA: hypothetical protein VKV95_21225 [Terriglobia bacterium]|nr:hypothetical protein [Terriglobia bacterium]
MREAAPCRRCGSTKTGSARRGLLYNIANLCGYRLRLCGGCRRLRLISRTQEAEPEVIRAAEVVTPAAAPPSNSPACPYCGSGDFRRSRRRWFDHLLKRPKMARCRQCHRRFPSSHFPPAKDDAEILKSA